MGNIISSCGEKPTPLSQVKLTNTICKDSSITKEITISPSFRSFSPSDYTLSMYNNSLYTFDKTTNIKKINIIFKNSKGTSILYPSYFNCTSGNYFLFIKKLSIKRANGTEELLNSYLFKNSTCNFNNFTLTSPYYGGSSSRKSIVVSASTTNEIELYNTGITLFNGDSIICEFKISNNNNTFSIQQNINFYISFVFYL
jgi:hypothetical protein